MSVFLNTSQSKVMKLTDKQMFENDYERLKNKFNFGNINQNKNINSYPLRLSQPNYQHIDSRIHSSKNEKNVQQIYYDYITNNNNNNISSSSSVNHGNVIKNNTNNQSSKTNLTKNNANSKSREKFSTNNSSCKKISYLENKNKFRARNKTQSSTDFRYSEKSFENPSSNNNSIIVNNTLKASEEFQNKLDKCAINNNYYNNSEKKQPANNIINNNKNINKASSNIISYNSFNKNNPVKNNQNNGNNEISANLFGNKCNLPNYNYNNNKNYNYSIHNKSSTAAKSISNISYNSRAGTPSNLMHLQKEEFKNQSNIDDNYENLKSGNICDFGQLGNKRAFVDEINDDNIKNIRGQGEKNQQSTINNNKKKEIILKENEKEAQANFFNKNQENVIDNDRATITQSNSNAQLFKNNSSYNNNMNNNFLSKQNTNSQKNLYTNIRNRESSVTQTLSNKGSHNLNNNLAQLDETERKSNRKFLSNNTENEGVFVDALDNLSQSSKGSIDGYLLHRQFSKKKDTTESHNIPSEENVDGKLPFANIKITLNFLIN